MGERSACRVLVENIKMDLQEIGWGSVDWIDLAQDRAKWRNVVNAVRPHKMWEIR
jgi:hypothetical protein